MTATLADLDNILRHAADRNYLEARNIRQNIKRAACAIATFPRAALYNPDKDYYERYVLRTRVILVYQVTTDSVFIIAAFHTSRNQRQKP